MTMHIIQCHAGHVIVVLEYYLCPDCDAPYCGDHKQMVKTCKHEPYKYNSELEKK